VRNFKKGDEVEAVVLAIDVERERISLGIKQLEGDPFNNFIATHDKNSHRRGHGEERRCARRGGRSWKSDEVEGYLRASEFSRERVEDLTPAPEGRRHDLTPMIINVDRKTRSINLSIKAKDQASRSGGDAEAGSRKQSGASGTTNLGALLKAKLEYKNSSKSASIYDQIGAHRQAGGTHFPAARSRRMPISPSR
jgi:small subunit ribosomal protein S1